MTYEVITSVTIDGETDAHSHMLADIEDTDVQKVVYGDGCVVERMDDGGWEFTPRVKRKA